MQRRGLSTLTAAGIAITLAGIAWAQAVNKNCVVKTDLPVNASIPAVNVNGKAIGFC